VDAPRVRGGPLLHQAYLFSFCFAQLLGKAVKVIIVKYSMEKIDLFGQDEGLAPEEADKVKKAIDGFAAAVDKVYMAKQEIVDEHGRHYDSLSQEEKSALISKRVAENDNRVAKDIEDLTT
jgi:hypothetical protein